MDCPIFNNPVRNLKQLTLAIVDFSNSYQCEEHGYWTERTTPELPEGWTPEEEWPEALGRGLDSEIEERGLAPRMPNRAERRAKRAKRRVKVVRHEGRVTRVL
jgi:hypothetical protein